MMVKKEHLSIFLALLIHNSVCMDKELTLTQAINSQDLETVKLLVNKRANVNKNGDESCCDNAPLMLATQRNYTAIAQVLIDNNADINATAASGHTALYYAVLNKNEHLVKLCISPEVINTQVMCGHIPLVIASQQGSTKIVKLLLENKAQDYDAACTALAYAAASGHTKTVKALLDNKKTRATIDNPCWLCGGSTALRLAVFYNHVDTVKLLLYNGATINILNAKGKTALTMKTDQTIKDLLAYYTLLEVETQNNPSTQTSIKIIEYGDYPELLYRLLLAGVSLEQDTLILAQKHNKKKIGRLLKNYLGIFGPELAISKTGITKTTTYPEMIADIARLIACYHSTL
jgi:uncharacterized protein